jgi:hypothetical protein
VRAAKGNAEAESLARLVADNLIAVPQLLPAAAAKLRGTFDLDAVEVVRATDHGWSTEPAVSKGAPVFVQIDDQSGLMLVGALTNDGQASDDVLLGAFLEQLRLQRRHAQLRTFSSRGTD